jgi:hypothetical protein
VPGSPGGAESCRLLFPIRFWFSLVSFGPSLMCCLVVRRRCFLQGEFNELYRYMEIMLLSQLDTRRLRKVSLQATRLTRQHRDESALDTSEWKSRTATPIKQCRGSDQSKGPIRARPRKQ